MMEHPEYRDESRVIHMHTCLTRLMTIIPTLSIQNFIDGDAERFIALTNREPMGYTRWREQNMYIGESVHDVAERARASAAAYFESQGRMPPLAH